MIATVPKWAAIMFAASIMLGILIAYRKHGVIAIAAITSQITAIIVIQLSTKAVMNTGFPHPMCIISLHFFSVWLVMLGLKVFQVTWGEKSKAHLSSILTDRPESTWSLTWYIRRFGPIAVLQSMNVILNTASLAYLDAGFNALIGVITPVVTTWVAMAFGTEIAALAWAGIAVAILGDGIVTIEGCKNIVRDGGNVSSALLGIGLGLLAMLARGGRSVLLDCQMNKYSGDEHFPKLSALETLSAMSPLVFFCSLAMALSFEGTTPYMELLTLSKHARSLLIFGSSCAVFLNYMGMYVIKILGAPAAQIAVKLNVLVTVAFSSAFFGERLSPLEIFGAMIVLCGAGLFEHAQQAAKKRASNEAQCIQEEKAKPTTYSSTP